MRGGDLTLGSFDTEGAEAGAEVFFGAFHDDAVVSVAVVGGGEFEALGGEVVAIGSASLGFLEPTDGAAEDGGGAEGLGDVDAGEFAIDHGFAGGIGRGG